jgi:hypothetical protein
MDGRKPLEGGKWCEYMKKASFDSVNDWFVADNFFHFLHLDYSPCKLVSFGLDRKI